MNRKTIEQMDRAELIGMVHALETQVEELMSPERNRLCQLGRLHDETDPAQPDASSENTSLWQRLAPRKKRLRLLDLDVVSRKFAPR